MNITRTTTVVSVSLPPTLVEKLDALRKKAGTSRSSIIASLIERYAMEKQWNQLRRWGEETAKKFRITSEDDIARILDAS